MQKIIKLGLLSIAFTFVFSVFAVSNANAQGPLTEILNRMEDHRNSIDYLKENVKMAKTDALLDETDIREGKVMYLPKSGRNDYVRLDWTKPVEEYLTVVKGKYMMYQPRLKQALCGDSKEAKGGGKANNALEFMSMSKTQLKANYDVKYLGKESVLGTSVAHLNLVPKKASGYKSADIWVNSDGMPIQAKVVERNNDSTTIQLSGIQKNSKIDGSKFSINLPSNVKCTRG